MAARRRTRRRTTPRRRAKPRTVVKYRYRARPRRRTTARRSNPGNPKMTKAQQEKVEGIVSGVQLTQGAVGIVAAGAAGYLATRVPKIPRWKPIGLGGTYGAVLTAGGLLLKNDWLLYPGLGMLTGETYARMAVLGAKHKLEADKKKAAKKTAAKGFVMGQDGDYFPGDELEAPEGTTYEGATP